MIVGSNVTAGRIFDSPYFAESQTLFALFAEIQFINTFNHSDACCLLITKAAYSSAKNYDLIIVSDQLGPAETEISGRPQGLLMMIARPVHITEHHKDETEGNARR